VCQQRNSNSLPWCCCTTSFFLSQKHAKTKNKTEKRNTQHQETILLTFVIARNVAKQSPKSSCACVFKINVLNWSSCPLAGWIRPCLKRCWRCGVVLDDFKFWAIDVVAKPWNTSEWRRKKERTRRERERERKRRREREKMRYKVMMMLMLMLGVFCVFVVCDELPRRRGWGDSEEESKWQEEESFNHCFYFCFCFCFSFEKLVFCFVFLLLMVVWGGRVDEKWKKEWKSSFVSIFVFLGEFLFPIHFEQKEKYDFSSGGNKKPPTTTNFGLFLKNSFVFYLVG